MKLELKDNKVFFENKGHKKRSTLFGLEKELMEKTLLISPLNKDYLTQLNYQKTFKSKI